MTKKEIEIRIEKLEGEVERLKEELFKPTSMWNGTGDLSPGSFTINNDDQDMISWEDFIESKNRVRF